MRKKEIANLLHKALLQGDKMEHYAEIHCEHDELARIWSLYPRDV